MKKFIAGLMIGMMLIGSVSAAAVYQLVAANYPIQVDGQSLKSGMPILNYQGSTYVPMRAVLEMMQAKVDWTGSAANIKTHKDMTVADVAAANLDNCVYIGIYKDYKIIATASGVLLPNGMIMTNKHVVNGGNRFGISFNDMPGTAESYSTETVIPDTKYDIAFIKSPLNKPSSIKYGDSDKVKIGDPVVSISSPKGVKNKVMNGLVTGIDYEGIRHSCKNDFGSSGGGIFNMNGEIISIEYAGNNDDTETSYSIPINSIKEFIK